MPRPMPFVAAVTSATLPAIPKSTSRHPKDVLPPAAINEGPPVAPRPSATVLLVRDGDPWELLMVRRPGGADFAPGAYVFPGGTVHEDDRGLDDELRAAAVRELFEETGILLARNPDVARVRELVDGGAAFPEALRQAGITPDFDALVMFARWITPALLRRRYDTRFYLARMPQGQSVTPQQGEIVDWRWVSPALALASHELTLVYATRAVLESVADARDVETLFARARVLQEIPIVEPRIVQTESGWEIIR
ncbi:MAG: NUDIX hydrolase [Chloroflexi bacterium]|nr:MAG: NUDIX hydrolase [Chloroflexota bacterium]